MFFGPDNATFFVPSCQGPDVDEPVKIKIQPYNPARDVEQEVFIVPKRKTTLPDSGESCGGRLARFRKAAGFSQRALAAELGISHRMVAYYEKQTEHPPTHLMPLLTKALGVSADQLLGLEKVQEGGRRRDTKLWRRFSQVEKLPPEKRKPIIQLMDAFLKSQKA